MYYNVLYGTHVANIKVTLIFLSDLCEKNPKKNLSLSEVHADS